MGSRIPYLLATWISAFSKRRSSSRPNEIASTRANNSWFVANTSSVVIVFVHGLFSDSATCWQCNGGDNAVFWPELVATDVRLGAPSIFLGGYHTSPKFAASRYGLGDCANELMRALRVPNKDQNVAVMDKQVIVFVCHSAGGAVVRYLLDAYAEEFVTKTVGLVLLASPSNGSRYANLLGLLPNWQDTLSAQLAWGNEILHHLDLRFRALLEARRIPSLIGAEAIESEPIGFGVLGQIVHRESAARYFADPANLAGTDHVTICKPDCEDHESHRFLVGFLTRRLKVTQPSHAAQPGQRGDESDARLALFEFYSQACEPYYVVRPIDDLITRAFSVSNLWLWGTTGCGKTSTIRRHAIASGKQYVYVSLGHIEANSIAAVLRDIWLTLQQRLNAAHPTVLNLPVRSLVVGIADLLAKHFSGSLVHLDEIPISDEAVLKGLWREINSVITAVDEQNPRSSMRFAISSLTSPDLRIPGKGLSERLQTIENPIWNSEQLVTLVTIIAEGLRLSLETDSIDELVLSAKGSPRFIKKVLRSYLIRGDRSSTSIRTHINETRREFE